MPEDGRWQMADGSQRQRGQGRPATNSPNNDEVHGLGEVGGDTGDDVTFE